VKLLIDAHVVGERETGNETYMVNLLRALARIKSDDEVFVAAAHPECVAPLIAGGRHCTIVPVSANPVRRLLYDLPRLASRFDVDLLCVTYTGPLMVNRPMVAVVHDVSFKRHPEWFSPRDRVVLTLGVGRTVRRASAVVTLSEFSKREIVDTCGVPAERIHVTPLAAAPEFGVEGRDDAKVHARYGLRRPYLLAVGNLQPRKNLTRLLEAFHQLQAQTDFRHDLVLAGSARWGAGIGPAIERLSLSDRVKLIGYVDSGELPALYRGADVFVYPSLYEGFGLPVLEAMACGTPVLASSGSSIPDVAGNAARLVNTESVSELAVAMAELCSRTELRLRLREQGLARSRMCPWERTASQTLDIFPRVAEAGAT
jgi:glycosyltransferase involved in cell wall biosynthesis